MPDPRTRSMPPAEFAIIRQRLGLSLADTARLLGVNERAVRRWADDTTAGPGPKAAAQLRELLADHDKRLSAELSKLRRHKTRPVPLSKWRTRKARPVSLLRYATDERLEAAGAGHATVRAQDAYLAELVLLLGRERISVEIVGDEQ